MEDRGVGETAAIGSELHVGRHTINELFAVKIKPCVSITCWSLY